MVQGTQYDGEGNVIDPDEAEFDAMLMGRSGPPWIGFGKKPVVGQYFEGYVVRKRARHKTKYQPESARQRGDAVEYEYWVGQKLRTSTKTEEQFKLEEPTARPNKEMVLSLRTALRDPENPNDDGVRQYALPRDAKAKLADTLRDQGIQGGLPKESFFRITLSELEQLPDLDTPKRHYKVEVWAPGEQPTPAPAQPQVQAPAQQPQYGQGGGGGVSQPDQNIQIHTQAPQQQQALAPQFPVYPDNVLAMMKQQGLACPAGNEARWGVI